MTGKAYGLIFNCLATRAVYVDVSPDYSSEKFLMALRRFISIRSYPLKLYLDNRAQLAAANKESSKRSRLEITSTVWSNARSQVDLLIS